MIKKRREPPKRTNRSRPGHTVGQRQLRVGEELRHALAKLLCDGECRDPVLQGASITITEVRMSPDLRKATAFAMPLAGANAVEILTALRRSAAFLKGRLAREVALRNTPSLAFELDDSFDRAERISALLARPEVARDLQPQPVGPEDRPEDRDDGR